MVFFLVRYLLIFYRTICNLVLKPDIFVDIKRGKIIKAEVKIGKITILYP